MNTYLMNHVGFLRRSAKHFVACHYADQLTLKGMV